MRLLRTQWFRNGAGSVAVALCLMSSAHWAGAQTTLTATTLIVTNRSRPVMRAALQLMAKYGYVITYEEPRYTFKGDLRDVTQERQDFNRFPPGKAPKVLRPVGGNVQLTLPTTTDKLSVDGALQRLVQSWVDSDQGGPHFQIKQEGDVFHIVPTEIRDRDGNWSVVQSILATPISLPNRPRTEHDMFKAICTALSLKVGVKVALALNGGFVVGPPETKQYALGAQEEPADSVLLRAFNLVDTKMTWILTYEPTGHIYFLNIDDIRTMPKQMIWPPTI